MVHCRHETYDVYVGRPTKWGNPFTIGIHGDRARVIARYEQWILTQPELLAQLPELRGQRLGCWCAPKPCHGDVLARLADAAGERHGVDGPAQVNPDGDRNPSGAEEALA